MFVQLLQVQILEDINNLINFVLSSPISILTRNLCYVLITKILSTNNETC